MWGDTEGLILLFLQFGVLKLLVGGWQLSGAESIIHSRLNRIYCHESIIFLALFKDWGRRVGSRFHLLCLMLIKGMRRWGEFKIFLYDPRDMGCA